MKQGFENAPLDASRSQPLRGGASYSAKHRLVRLVWGICWWVFASWTPAPFHPWRNVLLRCFGAKMHRSARVYGAARIWYPPNLRMDANACLGPEATCYCMAPIHLAEGSIVSQGAYLCAGTHEIDDPHFQLLVRPIVIGAGAWVAAGAFVGPGVTVGDRAVVGARAVLFKDAEPSGVYVGNPAKLIKFRKPIGAPAA